MFCGYCGNKLEDDAAFCPKCGKNIFEKIPQNEMKFCIKCGAKFQKDAIFCEKCGLKKQDYSKKENEEKEREIKEQARQSKKDVLVEAIFLIYCTVVCAFCVYQCY